MTDTKKTTTVLKTGEYSNEEFAKQALGALVGLNAVASRPDKFPPVPHGLEVTFLEGSVEALEADKAASTLHDHIAKAAFEVAGPAEEVDRWISRAQAMAESNSTQRG